jgi:hypothetical protein
MQLPRFATFLAAAMSIFLLAGCGADSFTFTGFSSSTIHGSGVAKTETRPVADFSEFDVSAAMNVELTVGPETKLEITADDNLLPHLKSEVVNGRLKLYFDASNSSKIGVKIKASTPSLKAYHGSGATSATVAGVKAEAFKLNLSGASKCTVAGSVDRLAIECSGASRANAVKLVARSVKADASGASTADVHAAESLDADASGAATIVFSGSPATLKKDASGASTIKAKG